MSQNMLTGHTSMQSKEKLTIMFLNGITFSC